MKIVILGSCRVGPYEIIKVPEKEYSKNGKCLWNTEEGFKQAFTKFKKAMDEADEIWVYAPDGLGEHTKRDLEYARKLSKKIKIIMELDI